MGEILNLTVIKTIAGNKVVKPDSDGYYKVTLGAFNVRNHLGDVYKFDGVGELLNDDKCLVTSRLKAGRLRSEADHPQRAPGMSASDFVLRNVEISMQCVCAHIKEINVKETSVSENIPGVGNVVIVEGLVKPSGVFGSALKESLDSSGEDTCFSIRSFTRDRYVNGITYKRVTQIVTWDWINAPGIRYASKLGSPAIESQDICKFDIDELAATVKTKCVSTESRDVVECIESLASDYVKDDILTKWSKV